MISVSDFRVFAGELYTAVRPPLREVRVVVPHGIVEVSAFSGWQDLVVVLCLWRGCFD